jgi:hypothetical protein
VNLQIYLQLKFLDAFSENTHNENFHYSFNFLSIKFSILLSLFFCLFTNEGKKSLVKIEKKINGKNKLKNMNMEILKYLILVFFGGSFSEKIMF